MASVAGLASGQTLGNGGSSTAPTASTETTAPAATTTSQNAPTKPYSPGPNTGSTASSGTVGNTATAGTPAADEMAPVIVTGSLIPTTADEVGPTEVAFVTNAQVQNTNSNNLFDALKRIDVSFQGGSNFGQETDNNANAVGESTLSIRNLSTLILLDGARLTTSPLSRGSSVDINIIPLAFIDHVEILKDGASTLYGSDAVGGVVNIITKKNFSGAEVNNQYGFAGDKGDYYSDTASIIGGATTDKASFFAGVEYHTNNEILTTDRPIADLSAAQDNNLGVYPESYFSGTAGGVVSVPETGGGTLHFIIAGSPFAKGAPGYNPAITTPGTLAPGYLTAPAATQIADFNAAGYIQTNTLPNYNDLGTFVDTNQFGVYAYTPSTTEKAFANMSYDFFPKTATMYGSFMFYNSQAQSNLAPQPVAPSISAYDITVPADNPYNPFGVAVGTGAAPADSSISVRYRFTDVGNRFFNQDNDYYHVLAGVKGDFGIAGSGNSDYHYNVSFAYDREESLFNFDNSVNGYALQQAVTPSAADPFINVLGTPTYNIFGIATNNSAATTNAIRTTTFQDGLSQLYETNGSLSGVTPLVLPGGPVSFAVGGEYRVEELSINVDGITQGGEAVGNNPQANVPLETRKTAAGFTEVNIPIISPDMHIPGVASFDVDGSARIEDPSGGSPSYIARVNGTWLPLTSNELSIRANFSQSYIVPTLFDLDGPVQVSANPVALPDGDNQEFIGELSSTKVPNTTAQNFGGGFTYTPKFAPGLTVSADYYNVIESGGETYPDYQGQVDNLEALGAASPYAKFFNFANGSHLTTDATDQITTGNFGQLNQAPTFQPTTQKTAGVDIKLDYVLPWKQWGVFTVGAVGTYLIDYADQLGVFDGPYQNKAGSNTEVNYAPSAQGLLPKWQVNPYFQYDWGGFDYTLDAEYIPATIDSTSDGGDDYATSFNYYQIAEYTRIDMTMSYEWGKAGGVAGFPWMAATPNDPKDPKDDKDMATGKESLATVTPNDWFDGLKLTVGVNNITDTTPPLVPSSQEDNTAKATYDIIGRFFFFQVDKKF